MNFRIMSPPSGTIKITFFVMILMKELLLGFANVVSDVPSLYFIGASKCATSSIARGLNLHPAIAVAKEGKETHIFDNKARDPASRLKALQSLFKPYRKSKFTYTISVEYTPEYIFEGSAVIERLCATLRLTKSPCPNGMKFLVVLREPVARTISSWKFKSAGGHEKRSLRDVVKQGAAIAKSMRSCYARYRKSAIEKCDLRTYLSPEPHNQLAMIAHSHVGKSLYYYQLMVWFSKFPRKQFLVMSMEHYYEDPTKAFTRIIEFAGASAITSSKSRAKGFSSAKELRHAATHHVNSVHIKKSFSKQVTAKEISKLKEVFKKPNCDLDRILGFRMGYCLNSTSSSAAAV